MRSWTTLTLHTLTSISAEESQTSHRIYTCFVNEPTADSYFVLYLFRIPLVKKKKKTDCNSLFVGVGNYSTSYSMLLIINTFNEFLKVIRGTEMLLVLSPGENSCSKKVYIINEKSSFLSHYLSCVSDEIFTLNKYINIKRISVI